MKYKRTPIFLLLLPILLLTGCQTPVIKKRLDNLEIPLHELQKVAASSLPLGLLRTSTNGREFYSNYFLPQKNRFKPVTTELQRYFAQIVVLGDRRPYTLELVVFREQRKTVGANFVVVGSDESLAQTVLKRVQELLAKRREGRNIIDDFRVF